MTGDDARLSIDVSRFTALSQMKAYLAMAQSEYWESHEFTALSSFLKGACCPTKVLDIFIYLDGHVPTRQEAMKAFARIGRLVSEGCTGE